MGEKSSKSSQKLAAEQIKKINSFKLVQEVNKINIPFKNLIKQKVKNGLIGEVPIGLLLSGGFDSGLLASLVSQSIENNFKIGRAHV